MYTLKYTGQFKKDLRLLKKSSTTKFENLQHFLKNLQRDGTNSILPKHKLHKLSGNFNNYWECHISPDLLIIWLYKPELKTFILVRTGTHSQLFK